MTPGRAGDRVRKIGPQDTQCLIEMAVVVQRQFGRGAGMDRIAQQVQRIGVGRQDVIGELVRQQVELATQVAAARAVDAQQARACQHAVRAKRRSHIRQVQVQQGGQLFHDLRSGQLTKQVGAVVQHAVIVDHRGEFEDAAIGGGQASQSGQARHVGSQGRRQRESARVCLRRAVQHAQPRAHGVRIEFAIVVIAAVGKTDRERHGVIAKALPANQVFLRPERYKHAQQPEPGHAVGWWRWGGAANAAALDHQVSLRCGLHCPGACDSLRRWRVGGAMGGFISGMKFW